MKLLKLKQFHLLLVCCFVVGLLISCTGTRTLMMTAPNTPKGTIAQPALSFNTLPEWEEARRSITEQLSTEIYGKFYVPEITISTSKTLMESAFNDTAYLEEITIGVKGHYKAQNQDPEYSSPERSFKMLLLTPRDAKSSVPVIMMQSFCPNHNVVPLGTVSKPINPEYNSCDFDGPLSKVFGYFFGRYIVSPPIEAIMERGYALAIVFPHDFIPDDSERGLKALNDNFPDSGAISVWATQFSAIAKVLSNDNRLSDKIAYGHSRFGKSALVAAAYDANINGVIAHQSGTGGASLSRDKKGETVEAITKRYPHWFHKNYHEDELRIDQHHLLALIAPRPILLGNAKRDVWSDPDGAFRAAQGATPIYELYGSAGLQQSKLNEYRPQADIAFWMRPGTHGVVKEDWPAFLEFLDAHFKKK